MADKIIIEVNTRLPSFEGLHDISMCDLPPNRKPYLIMNTEDRIGTVSSNIIDTIRAFIEFYILVLSDRYPR